MSTLEKGYRKINKIYFDVIEAEAAAFISRRKIIFPSAVGHKYLERSYARLKRKTDQVCHGQASNGKVHLFSATSEAKRFVCGRMKVLAGVMQYLAVLHIYPLESDDFRVREDELQQKLALEYIAYIYAHLKASKKELFPFTDEIVLDEAA